MKTSLVRNSGLETPAEVAAVVEIAKRFAQVSHFGFDINICKSGDQWDIRLTSSPKKEGVSREKEKKIIEVKAGLYDLSW